VKTTTGRGREPARPQVRGLLGAALLCLLLPGASPAAPATTVPGGDLGADATWEGEVLLEHPLTVLAEATLTLLPGTVVRLRPEAAIVVQGALRAEGTAEAPVTMEPAEAGGSRWGGVTFSGGDRPSVLARCRVRGAAAIGITRGTVRIEDCEISGGALGVAVSGDESRATIADNRLADLEGGGIRVTENAEPAVTGNLIERCGPWGILASSGAAPGIRGNRVSACASGIEIDQTGARVSGNLVRDCERGIALTSVAGPEPVRGNRLEGNRIGILAQHFSSVEISDNVVTGGGEGIVCFRGASAPLRHNEVAGNDTGILANQMANPEISGNRIAGNRRGVYLHLSSYAILHGNDIVDNEVQIELGNMSLDWERRSGFKPMRGLQQRSQGRVERGREVPGGPTADGFAATGEGVDATGNWWGEAATAEMAARGPAANLPFIVDGYDTPVRTYEGWEGVYAQDRVIYAPWAPAPVPGAGPRPATEETTP